MWRIRGLRQSYRDENGGEVGQNADKAAGKSRPSAVNILEGPRSFELQIWWEISPWVTGVYPVS